VLAPSGVLTASSVIIALDWDLIRSLRIRTFSSTLIDGSREGNA
jgi:hypothetical protein